MGLEPTTFCLGSRHSTAELHPRAFNAIIAANGLSSWRKHDDPSILGAKFIRARPTCTAGGPTPITVQIAALTWNAFLI